MRKQDVIDYLKKNPDAVSDEFIVRRRVTTVKKTFEVETAILEKFMTEAKQRGLKVKDAINEALSAWIKK